MGRHRHRHQAAEFRPGRRGPGLARRRRTLFPVRPLRICGGSRLNARARSVKVDGRGLDELAALELRTCGPSSGRSRDRWPRRSCAGRRKSSATSSISGSVTSRSINRSRPFGRRIPAGEDGPPARLRPRRSHLCPRRAEHRTPSPRHRPSYGHARKAPGQGQQRHRRRTRPGRDPDRRSGDRHRSGRGADGGEVIFTGTVERSSVPDRSRANASGAEPGRNRSPGGRRPARSGSGTPGRTISETSPSTSRPASSSASPASPAAARAV